ncbi:Cro/CI family transcriptional regulator [Aeromonas caviae]|uniref:Cro/CI family transcriptional regulator n=1 Tax=Aeromonas caviae TaxID=648 RepID=UPI003EC5902D
MKKQDAINFFGGNNALARALGAGKSTVSEWPAVIPEQFATRIHSSQAESWISAWKITVLFNRTPSRPPNHRPAFLPNTEDQLHGKNIAPRS